MKIYFIRHGEAMDDVRNEYGGWYDPELAPAGIESAKKMARILKEKNIKVDKLLTSPLKRATQTAEIVGQEMGLVPEINIYLKERNTYGLLCGVNIDEAEIKYPELTTAYKNGDEVLGYENYEFFLKRVRVLIDKLSNVNEDLICITHGKLLGAIFKDLLGKPAKKIHESCVVETELENGDLKLVSFDGVELE